MRKSDAIRERLERRTRPAAIKAQVLRSLIEQFSVEIAERAARNPLPDELAAPSIKRMIHDAIDNGDPLWAGYLTLMWWDRQEEEPTPEASEADRGR
jgi:hypothetical protein